jgi:hypothetical protein
VQELSEVPFEELQKVVALTKRGAPLERRDSYMEEGGTVLGMKCNWCMRFHCVSLFLENKAYEKAHSGSAGPPPHSGQNPA